LAGLKVKSKLEEATPEELIQALQRIVAYQEKRAEMRVKWCIDCGGKIPEKRRFVEDCKRCTKCHVRWIKKKYKAERIEGK
jgi:hypothetical protein